MHWPTRSQIIVSQITQLSDTLPLRIPGITYSQGRVRSEPDPDQPGNPSRGSVHLCRKSGDSTQDLRYDLVEPWEPRLKNDCAHECPDNSVDLSTHASAQLVSHSPVLTPEVEGYLGLPYRIGRLGSLACALISRAQPSAFAPLSCALTPDPCRRSHERNPWLLVSPPLAG